MRVIEFDYPVKQVTYKTVGERKLSLYIFEPEHSNASAKNRTVILFFNGGSFKKDLCPRLNFRIKQGIWLLKASSLSVLIIEMVMMKVLLRSKRSAMQRPQ